MCNRRNQNGAIVFKTDKTAIEQMIDVWCQEQPILAIQTFVVACVAPRFAMTGSEMLDLLDSGHTAT